jgi:hypothetical protein
MAEKAGKFKGGRKFKVRGGKFKVPSCKFKVEGNERVFNFELATWNL